MRGYRASDVATALRCHRPSITICSRFVHHLITISPQPRVPSKRLRNCLAMSSPICSPFHHHLITISPQQRGVTHSQLPHGVITPSDRHGIVKEDGDSVRGVPSKRRRNCLAVTSYFYHHRIAICSHFTATEDVTECEGYRASDVATASRCHLV